MENLSGYIYFVIDEFEYSILLPTHDVEVKVEEDCYVFTLSNNAKLIINGFDHGDGRIIINRKDGAIVAGFRKPIDVSYRLVEEFIQQHPDLHNGVCEYLKANPLDLFCVSKGSTINVNPTMWVWVSNELTREKDEPIESLMLSGYIGEPMAEKFEKFLQNQALAK